MTDIRAFIEYNYFKAKEAFEAGNYNQAAILYKQCYDSYQNADLHTLDKSLKDTVADAYRKYEELTNK